MPSGSPWATSWNTSSSLIDQDWGSLFDHALRARARSARERDARRVGEAKRSSQIDLTANDGKAGPVTMSERRVFHLHGELRERRRERPSR
jgi:hypothetical protein